MDKKIDTKLIAQLMSGNIFNEKPESVDPTKAENVQKGGGGNGKE